MMTEIQHCTKHDTYHDPKDEPCWRCERERDRAVSETKSTALPYRCHGCGAAYCKLWREYQTIASVTQLLCVDCALKDQKKDWKVSEDGHHIDEHGHRGSDQIGCLVPAVPTAKGDTYWGYTSVPLAGCRWWTALPLREIKDPLRR